MPLQRALKSSTCTLSATSATRRSHQSLRLWGLLTSASTRVTGFYLRRFASAVQVQHLIDTTDRVAPKTKQALRSPDFENGWKQACAEGVAKFKENKTYAWARPDPGANVVACKWVFDLQDQAGDENSTNKVPRARPIVCGNYEEAKWAVENLYSAMASTASFKMLCAHVGVKDPEWRKFDFVPALLNSKLPKSEWIFVYPSPSVELEKGLVWWVQRGLYGLRGAPPR